MQLFKTFIWEHLILIVDGAIAPQPNANTLTINHRHIFSNGVVVPT